MSEKPEQKNSEEMTKREKIEAQSWLLSLVGGRKSLVAIVGLIAITLLASLDKLDTEILTAISALVAVYIGGNVVKK